MDSYEENSSAPYLIFNRLFVEYVQSFLFKHANDRFDSETIFRNMPTFYQNREMVKAALHILMMEQQIVQTREPQNDFYQANPDAIAAIKREVERKALADQFDIKIKEMTIQQFRWQKIPIKYWYFITLLTVLLSIASSLAVHYITNKFSSNNLPVSGQKSNTTVSNSH